MLSRKIKNIAMFFNGDRGITVYNKLIKKYKIILIFTNSKIIKKKFKKKKVIYSNNINDEKFYRLIKKENIDLFISAGFSSIFKKKILNLPKYGVINLHAGPVPKYRGGSPLNWQLINNEKKITVSVLKMNEGIDTGPIIEVKKFPIKKNYDIKKIHLIVNNIFPSLVLKSINKIEKNEKFKLQPKNINSYWQQRNEEDGKIFFNKFSGFTISRYIRALTKPYPGAWALLNGKKIIFYEAKLINKKINGGFGSIVTIKDKIYLKCRIINLHILKYKLIGKKIKKFNHLLI